VAALEAHGLSRAYGRLVALASLDFSVSAGECVALVGANGSGKSTTVRTIAGLLEPSSGTVRVCGHDPHVEPEAELARAALALVPDTPLLYDDLTVRQHLQLVTISHGATGPDTDERIECWLERLGLSARADFLPRELSRGMRQKTQLACALVRPADVLLLDEPVVGLDPASQALLREVLRERKLAGTAVLLTTHQLQFADGLADRAIVLDEGTVNDEGRWTEVRERAEARGWTSP
jgi:ABC-type multidrug transport system ATPase subunit